MIEALHFVMFAVGVCAFLVTLPGTLELLVLTIGAARTVKRTAVPDSQSLRLAVVIPAHNEAELIARCVASVSASATCQAGVCEIVVVADNCTDDTGAKAIEAGARVLVRRDDALRGKGYALRLAFERLQPGDFEAYLVLDADSVVSQSLVSEVKRALSSGAAAVQCRYQVLNCSASIRTRLMDLAFLAFNVMRPKGRSGCGLSAGILGNGFALRREVLKEVPWDSTSIVEDLEYHLRLAAAGVPVAFINDATVFGEIPSNTDAARAQRARWEGGRLRILRQWAPRLAIGVLRGNLRLLEPLLELLLLPLAYHALLLAAALFVLPEPWRLYAFGALLIVVVHVLGASVLGARPLQTAAALAAAPFYVIWKVINFGSVLAASRRDADWVRTGRDRQVSPRPAK